MTGLVFRDDPYAAACEARVVAVREAGGAVAVLLDRTVFYPMGGGQPGDSGSFALAGGRTLAVADARKGESESEVLHLLAAGEAPPAAGEALVARLDWPRRHRHMRLHTALHLLCAVVRAPVTGGRIAADKAHLDFDVEMEKLVKEDIEAGLAALIAAGHPVTPRWVDEAELDTRPELVKTMSVAPPRGEGRVRLLEIPGIDLQACGGTHVANTAEVGRLAVLKIRSEGRHNRRVTLGFAG